MIPPASVSLFLERCGAGTAVRERLPQMAQFYADLVAWNARTNLTRITSPEEFWVKHVADSLAVAGALPALLRAPLRVADVGCGAGFPLFPLAWGNPELRLTGMEINGKKLEFLRQEVAALGLRHVEILGRQGREAGRLPEHAAGYDAVVGRAVFNPTLLVRETRQLLRPGGVLAVFSTPTAVRENWDLARREANKYHLHLTLSEPLDLPEDGGPRQFFLFTRPAGE
ncbi:MAG: 16S rRNA (guanine(527)-N(7))-methyltransferase RsmG [Lentisphaeria bacterium]